MSRSESLFARARQHIPGGVNSPVRAFRAVGGDPIFFQRGEGAYLVDVGRRLRRGFFPKPSASRDAVSR